MFYTPHRPANPRRDSGLTQIAPFELQCRCSPLDKTYCGREGSVGAEFGVGPGGIGSEVAGALWDVVGIELELDLGRSGTVVIALSGFSR